MGKTSEKETKPTLRCRLEGLDKQQLTAFCSFLGLHGASFYTMRGKLMYETGTFDLWEERGVERMIRDYAPDYGGEPQDFFDSIEEKAPFIQYMVDKGGMGKTSCYQRFKIFNFKKWELIGLQQLADRFLQQHVNRE